AAEGLKLLQANRGVQMRLRTNSGKRLGFERLEERTVLNGTVIVKYEGSGLLIESPDDSNHGILVRGTGSTAAGATIKVSGLGGTHIETVGDPKSAITQIDIGLGNGRDQVIMQSVHVSGVINIITDGGNDTEGGNDILSVVNVSAASFSVSLEAGNDV